MVASATGNAIVPLPGALDEFPNFGHRTFAFTARQYADGSVSGQWVRDRSDPAGPSQFNGIILCMTIDGNNVWIGTLTVGGDRDGLEGGVRAVDNGEGPDFPDEMTLHTTRRPTGFAANYCATKPINQFLFQLGIFGAGQVQIR